MPSITRTICAVGGLSALTLYSVLVDLSLDLDSQRRETAWQEDPMDLVLWSADLRDLCVFALHALCAKRLAEPIQKNSSMNPSAS